MVLLPKKVSGTNANTAAIKLNVPIMYVPVEAEKGRSPLPVSSIFYSILVAKIFIVFMPVS